MSSGGGSFLWYDTNMKLQPARNIVVIEADKPAKQTASGIYIVEDWATLPPIGTVLAIGPDVTDRDLVGKRVVFERYGAVRFKDDIKLCLESHLLAVIKGTDDE